jgi:UDP-N-acetyl-D-glucosamine dehydrogenase
MRGTADLRRRVLNRQARVGVIGQGYVGLSLACASAAEGFETYGFDVDEERVACLSRGEPCVAGVDEAVIAAGVGSGLLSFGTDPGGLASCDVVAICVPTPLRDHSPDLSFVESAALTVAGQMRPGTLVILESTTYPGTTEQVVRPLLETTGLACERDFLVAYSPERIDPGNVEFGFREVPRVVGGVSAEATGIATLFYEQLVDKVMAVSSTRTAELAKLLENTFRHVNIALVNEMAMVCHDLDIDVWEVIDAAASKPFGFMRFSPGPGVGGHCIPLDPTYLTWQVRRDTDRRFRVVEQAEEINSEMPGWVSGRIAEALNDAGKAVKEADVLILGIAYKPDVGDIRESPALRVMADLGRRGAKVSFHDPFVEQVRVGAAGEVLWRRELTRATVADADCVVVLTPHATYDLAWVAEHARLVFDARDAVPAAAVEPGRVKRL